MASLVATVPHPPTIIWPMFWKSPPSVGQWGNSTKKEKKSYLSSRYTLVLSEPGKCLKDIFFFSGGDLVSSPESPVGNAPLLFLQCEQPHLHFGEWLHQESSGPSLEFCFLFFFGWGPISPASSLLHRNEDDPDPFPHQEPSSAQWDTLRQPLS